MFNELNQDLHILRTFGCMSEVGHVRATFRTFRATFGSFLQTKTHKKDIQIPPRQTKITKNDQKYQRDNILHHLNQDLYRLKKICLDEYVWAS
jgi:hypothetical protein